MGGCCSFLCPSSRLPQPSSLVKFAPTTGLNCDVSNFSVRGKEKGGCTVLANSPLLQNYSAFEFTLREKGEFCVGVGGKGGKAACHLNQRENSWCLFSGPEGGDFEAGVVIGCTFDLSAVQPVLRFYRNGEVITSATIQKGICGEVFPAVSVGPGCVLQANFGQAPFSFTFPSNFEGVIYTQDMM